MADHGRSLVGKKNQQKLWYITLLHAHTDIHIDQLIFVLLNLCARPFSQLKFSSLLDVITSKSGNVVCDVCVSISFPAVSLSTTRVPQLEDKVKRVSKNDAASHWAFERRSVSKFRLALRPAIVWVQQTLNSSASYEVFMDLDGFLLPNSMIGRPAKHFSIQKCHCFQVHPKPAHSTNLGLCQRVDWRDLSNLGKMIENYFWFFFVLFCSFYWTILWYYGPWLHSHSQALWKDYSGKIGVDGWNLISLDTMLNENIGNPKTPDTTKSTHPGALMVWQLVTQGTIPQCQRRDASLLRSHWSLPLLLLLLWVFSVSTRISQSSSGTAGASPDLISIVFESFVSTEDWEHMRKYEKIWENVRSIIYSYIRFMILFCVASSTALLYADAVGGFCTDAFWSFFLAPKGFEQRKLNQSVQSHSS